MHTRDIEKLILGYLTGIELEVMMHTSRHFLALIGTDDKLGPKTDKVYRDAVALKLYHAFYIGLKYKFVLDKIHYEYPWLARRARYLEAKLEYDKQKFNFSYYTPSTLDKFIQNIGMSTLAYGIIMLAFLASLVWVQSSQDIPQEKKDYLLHHQISLAMMFNLGMLLNSTTRNIQEPRERVFWFAHKKLSMEKVGLRVFGFTLESELSKLGKSLESERSQQMVKAMDDKNSDLTLKEFKDRDRVSALALMKYKRVSLVDLGVTLKVATRGQLMNQAGQILNLAKKMVL